MMIVLGASWDFELRVCMRCICIALAMWFVPLRMVLSSQRWALANGREESQALRLEDDRRLHGHIPETRKGAFGSLSMLLKMWNTRVSPGAPDVEAIGEKKSPFTKWSQPGDPDHEFCMSR